MTGSRAIRSLRKVLRNYNAIIVGDEGIEDAYHKFLRRYGIEPMKPTKGQKEIDSYLSLMLSPATTKTDSNDREVNCQTITFK